MGDCLWWQNTQGSPHCSSGQYTFLRRVFFGATHVVVVDVEDVEVGRVVVHSVVNLAGGDLVAVIGNRAHCLELVAEVGIREVLDQALLEVVEVVVKSRLVQLSTGVVLTGDKCRSGECRSEDVQKAHGEQVTSDSRKRK